MEPGSDPRAIPLALVGLGCRLPGADNLDQYWEMLIEGRCAVADLPPERLDAELYFDPKKGVRHKTYTHRGAIPSSRQFDPEQCPIAPELVRQADPTHLVLCQVAADALRHAGMDPLALPLRNTGVYVGHTLGSEWDADEACVLQIDEAAEVLREVPAFGSLPPEQQEAVARDWVSCVRGRLAPKDGEDRDLASHMAAGIIAKGLGLTGPFVAVNAACASSLQALLLAARALQRGSIDMAIVGGASVCGSEWLVLFSAAQSLSATQSRPFDDRADGLIVAEGYVAVVLKTLERAMADGDPIQAVLRGIGVSSDGKGRSLWAPRREGQVEAIRRAYEVGPRLADLQYVEAHATATQLGDATEVAALAEVLAGVLPAGHKIPVTSVKANLGHALEAAGLASLVKVVLSMQHGTIPPAVNLQQLNPSIDWQHAPVHVPQTAIPWPTPAPGRPRTAGVNAFGIGGLNVHVALEAYDAARPHPIAVPAVVRDPDDEAVAVIGRGCVFPDAPGVGAFWDLVRSGRDARRPSSNGHPSGAPLPGGRVESFSYDWRRHKIPPKQIECADPLQFMALEAADQALAEAGYAERPFDRKRTGVVVGTEFVGDFSYRLKLLLRFPQLGHWLREILIQHGLRPEDAAAVEQGLDELLNARWPVLADESGSFSASSSAVRIAKTWNLMGGAAALDSGPTSGLTALNAAIDQLLSGDCELMLCVAAQRHLNRRAYERLRRQGMLATDLARGPFDRNGSGLVPGEGVGAFLLKRLSHARRDGDPIRAIVRGVGAAHGEDAAGLRQALDQALAGASLSMTDLAAVITDAVGMPRADEPLLRALLDSEANSRAAPLPVTSLVGQIGHTGGASAAASLLAATLALQEQRLPGLAGLQAPLATLRRNRSRLECPTQTTPLAPPHPNGRLLAAVLSHGKGLAWSAVVEQGVAVATPPTLPSEKSDSILPDSRRIAHRSVLRAVDAALPAVFGSDYVPDGAVVIVGENPAGAALGRLLARHATVYPLKPSQGITAVLTALEQLPADPPVRAMFVMTALDAGGERLLEPETWALRRQLGVELPYLVLQRWGQLLEQRGDPGPFTLAAATRLGGDFGVTPPVVAPEGGWISGLLKAIALEWNRYGRPTRVNVCDFAREDSPDQVAESLLAELADGASDVEVGWGGGRRRTIETIAAPIESLPRREVPRGTTWVVTGGARGITAEVAVALGQNFDLDLHLLGRSPEPREDAPWRDASEESLTQIKRSIVRQAIREGKSPEKQWERVKNDIEIAKNLQRMRALGLRVTYYPCDVSDRTRLAQVLADIRRTSGPITGIVHGAGYARTGRLENQRLDELRASIGAKVEGAVNLIHLTREDPLRYFLGFGSISGRYGGNGLSDYAAGNDMLAKLCVWFRTVRPQCAATCIQWQSWDAVGMAMLPDSQLGAREVLRMQFLAPEEGVEHLKRELSAGLPASEVLIEDGQFERMLRAPQQRAVQAMSAR